MTTGEEGKYESGRSAGGWHAEATTRYRQQKLGRLAEAQVKNWRRQPLVKNIESVAIARKSGGRGRHPLPLSFHSGSFIHGRKMPRFRPALLIGLGLLLLLALHSLDPVAHTTPATSQVHVGTATVTDLLLRARLSAVEQAAATTQAVHSAADFVSSSLPLDRAAAEPSRASLPTSLLPVTERREQPEAARKSVAEALAQPVPPSGSALRGIADSEQALKESDTVRRLLQLDGQPRWTAASVVGRTAPAVHPPNADVDLLLSRVPAGGTAWLGFGSAGVLEMLTNWAHHVIQLGHGDSMMVRRRVPATSTKRRAPVDRCRNPPASTDFTPGHMFRHTLATAHVPPSCCRSLAPLRPTDRCI